MTERTQTYDEMVAEQARAWNSRFDFPQVTVAREYNHTPAQRDVDMAHLVDSARIDPMSMLRAQERMLREVTPGSGNVVFDARSAEQAAFPQQV